MCRENASMKSLYLLFGSLFLILSTTSYGQNSTGENNNIQTLERGKSLKREIRGGESQFFQLKLNSGQFARVLVKEKMEGLVANVASADGKYVTGANYINPEGIKDISWEAKADGIYKIEIGSYLKPEIRGQYEIVLTELLTAEQYQTRLNSRSIFTEPVKQWLAANSIPLRTVETDNNFSDLEPLKKVFRNVQIVGMGEATHGTREFFQFKHRLFAFLVKEMGYSGFVMEADVTSCEEANEFVSGGKGDAVSVLKPLYGIWRTQEVSAMLDWMRQFNQTAASEKKINFLCFDMQAPQDSLKKLQIYIQQAAPEKTDALEEFIKTINGTRPPAFNSDKEKAKSDLAKFEQMLSDLEQLDAFITANKNAFTTKLSAGDFEKSLRYLQLARQGVDIRASSNVYQYSSKRDRYMAENVRYFVSRAKPQTRFAIWAHNGHILPGLNVGKNLGTILRESFGQKYYALGFAFGEGSFAAVDSAGAQQKFRDFTVGKGAEYSLDWYLALPERGSYIIDFRQESKTKAVSDWKSQTHGNRTADFSVSEEQLKNWSDSKNLYQIKPGKTCDGMIFIDKTNGARRN